MKVLVTGGGGFLGHYIVDELLRAGHRVVAYQRSPHPDLQARGVEVRQGSLLEAEALRTALQGCEAVLHTAAKAGVWGTRKAFFSTNVDGTRILLEAMEGQGVGKIVYCSSPSVVFDGSSFEGGDESLPYGSNWHCAYPESKVAAEKMVLEWGRSGKGRAIALRPHLMWGIGDPHILPVVLERSRQGRFWIIGDGRNRVDLCRVENAARAHLLALQALDRPEAVNRPYFVSQGQPVRLWGWVNEVLQAAGLPPLRRRIPLPLAFAMGAVFEAAWPALRRPGMPPMTRFAAVEMARSHWFNIDAARRELGFQPEEFPIDEGLRLYVEAWKCGRTPLAGRQ